MAKKKGSFLGSLFKATLFSMAVLSAYAYYEGYRLDDLEMAWKEITKKIERETDTVEIEKTDSEEITEGPASEKKTVSPTVEKEPTLEPLPENPYAAIDARARKCPATAEASVQELAAYLEEGTSTDLEKARAIYIWLTHNVSYDDAAYNTGNYSDYSALSVLRNRLAVCEGFSNLYQALGEAMGLNIMKIVGYAKGYGYSMGSHFEKLITLGT